MQDIQNVTKYAFVTQDRPVLIADIAGNADHPDVIGTVYVYTLPDGVYMQGDIVGLPASSNFSFHVHEGTVCGEPGEKLLVLPDVMSGEDGKASAQVQLDRVDSTQIAGRPIVLHLKAADGTEPQIACGLLVRIL